MSAANFWNERFASDEFIYGTQPNDFLVECCSWLKGPVLSLSEGEGRNAVYLAQQGLEVLGVDISDVALEKAQQLACVCDVEIDTLVADLNAFIPKLDHYLSVTSIFAHLPSPVRNQLYPRVEESMKQGGLLVFEAYSEKQLERDTGGPKDLDLLVTLDQVREEFPNLEPVVLREVEREVVEGVGHNGMASVIQFIGRKV